MSYPVHSGGPIDSISVGGTSTLIFNDDPTHQFRCISNPDATLPVFIALGVEAAVDSGIIIPPLGKYEFTEKNMFKGRVYGITGGTTIKVATQIGL